MQTARTSLIAALATSFLLTACGGPSAEEVSERTSSVLSDFIVRGGRTLNSEQNRKALKQFSEIFGQLFSSLGQSEQSINPSTSAPPPYPDDDSGTADDGFDFDLDLDFDLDKMIPEGGEEALAAQLEQALQQAIFNEENIESSSAGKTTFLLPSELLCGGVIFGDSDTAVATATPDGDWTYPDTEGDKADETADDSSCPFLRPEFSLRIDASLVGDGIELGLRVGNSSKALVVVVLEQSNVALRVDLEAAKELIGLVEQATGKSLDLAITEMKGVVEFSLGFSAAEGIVLGSSILEAIAVALNVDQRPFSLHLGATAGLATLQLEAGQISSESNMGTVDLQFAADLFAGSLFNTSPPELLQIKSAGGQGKLSIDAQGVVSMESTLLAAVEMRYGETVVASVDINPESGRLLQMSLADLDSAPTISLAPEVDLQVSFKFDVLNPYLKKAAPSWAANETYRVWLQDASKMPVIGLLKSFLSSTTQAPQTSDSANAEDDDTTPDNASLKAILRLVKGSLSLESTVIPVKIDVAAGQCLLLDNNAGAATALGNFSSGPCPQ
jgi:hypothetical protein